MKSSAMSLAEHLEALRWTLLKMLGLLVLGASVSWCFYDPCFNLLMSPLKQVARPIKLITVAPLDAFTTKLTLSILLGLCATLPGQLFLAWSFVSPGLKEAERRVGLWVVTSGTFFFGLGMVFAYNLLGLLLNILVGFTPAGVEPIWQFNIYIDFAFRLLLAFGLLFELPVVVVLLVTLELVQTRTLAKIRPHMILAIFIVAGVLTPPDVMSQILLGVPLVLLYELGLLVGRFQERRIELGRRSRKLQCQSAGNC